ncbi:MAG: hypothetical protein ACRCTI_18970 [Beijerinckiaceae bacterium]
MQTTAETLTIPRVDLRDRPFRDLADFHLRWPDYRHAAEEAARAPGLKPDQREVLEWLVRLADRVGRKDIS